MPDSMAPRTKAGRWLGGSYYILGLFVTLLYIVTIRLPQYWEKLLASIANSHWADVVFIIISIVFAFTILIIFTVCCILLMVCNCFSSSKSIKEKMQVSSHTEQLYILFKKKEYVEAATWFHKSAEQGHLDAQLRSFLFKVVISQFAISTTRLIMYFFMTKNT